jgi:hypothetical protein
MLHEVVYMIARAVIEGQQVSIKIDKYTNIPLYPFVVLPHLECTYTVPMIDQQRTQYTHAKDLWRYLTVDGAAARL